MVEFVQYAALQPGETVTVNPETTWLILDGYDGKDRSGWFCNVVLPRHPVAELKGDQ